MLETFALNFAIVKYNFFPTHSENNNNAILKSPSNLFMGR